MSSRLLPSVADNVLQFIYRYIHLAQAQECFVDFKPSVSLDNNDRTWLEIHSGPEHPLVPALEADEGMRHVWTTCSKYMIYAKQPILWQEGNNQGCILQEALKQSHMTYGSMM